MNRIEINGNHQSITKAIGIFIIAALCQMFSMVKSGFLSRFNTEVSLSFIALIVFMIIVFKIFKTNSSAYIASFVSVLLFADWSQLMLYYTCNQENEIIKNNVIGFMIYTIGAIAATWILFLILNRIKNARNICLILFSVVAVGMSAFIFLVSGRGNNTSTVGGFQPAILMLFLMLYAFSGATAGNHDSLTRSIYLSLFWLMMISLAWKHEFGIPVMTYAACMLTYLFFNSSKNKKKWLVANLLIPIIGVSGIMITNSALRTDTIGKLTNRLNENEHWLMAKKNLQASALFGSEKYDVFLAEASTDYSLNTSTHFWGFFWLAVMLFSFFMMTISVYSDVMQNNNDNVISNMRKLSYCAVCVIVIYNILDNICGFPVVGVQNICCGVSKSIALLSGLLIGSIMIDPLKAEFHICEFLKERQIITEST